MKKILLTLLLSLSALSYSQDQSPPCASDALLRNLARQFPEVTERLALFENSLLENRNGNNKAAATIPPANSITIPVVVYIVHDGTATTNITDSRVNDQITALNSYFLSTGIRFCLASKVNGNAPIPTVNASDIQNTPGIIHVNNATLSTHSSANQSPLVATASSQITKNRYLRIWVVKSIDGSGTLGYSMFPNTSPIFDGIVMRYDTFGNGNIGMLTNYNLGKVLAHEVGHYLFLYHTFEGGCAATNSDCSIDGDRVCDTPAVAAPNFNCVAGTNSCPETPAALDDLSNYMDYGNNNCQNHFTNGQIERMLEVLTLYRSSLFTTENSIFTGTCDSANLLSATIACSNFTSCASPTQGITFTAPAATTYSWSFGDPFATGSNPNTSNTQFASHIYTSAANSPYTVTLTVTSNGQTRTSSELIYVTNCISTGNANTFWYVDSSYGLNFSTGVPFFDPSFPSANFANLSCNSQSDTSGNLLFYTNKFKVWNRQHSQINSTNLMLNTTGSSSNQVLCVPKPPASGNVFTEYYIFTQQSNSSGATDKGFRYNIVNVSGTDATMGIIAQPVTIPSSYGFDVGTDGALLGGDCLTAVKKCNSNDYWIITLLKKGTVPYLVVFSLSNAGLVYNSEQMVTNGNSFLLDCDIYSAPNGNKIALAHPYGGANIHIYDFNKAAGILTNTFVGLSIPETPIPSYGQSFGACFSPDSNLLYVTDYFAKKLYQFNINSTNVIATRIEVASATAGPWSMKVGPDNKMYVSMGNSSQKLAVIHNPNNAVSTQNPNACNFSLNGPGVPFAINRIGPGLPNLIDAKQETAYFNPNTPNVVCKYITGCNTYKFFPNVCGTSFAWTFTNTILGTSFTTTVTNPTYNFAQNGSYVVTVRDNSNVLLGTSSPIVITNATAPTIAGSTTACLTRANESVTNNSISLNAGETATWTITAGTGTITGPSNMASVTINWSVLPGTITLTKVNASGCTSLATRTVTSFCAPLSIDEIVNNSIQITPNPSRGLFTINSAAELGKMTLTVYDLRGRAVLTQKNVEIGMQKTIDLSGCQAGMYLLKLIGSGFSYSGKLIKE